MTPQATPEAILTALRQGGEPAQQFSALLARDATIRAAVVADLAASLQPTDHILVRRLLETEIAAHEQAGQSASETLYTLVAALARYADAQDILLIWRAHEATPETRAGLDVEQAMRAGIEPVRQRLQTLIANANGAGAKDAADALAWLEAGIAAGAADDLPGYFTWADERFGLRVSGPT